jgi:hypothetical protein
VVQREQRKVEAANATQLSSCGLGATELCGLQAHVRLHHLIWSHPLCNSNTIASSISSATVGLPSPTDTSAIGGSVRTKFQTRLSRRLSGAHPTTSGVPHTADEISAEAQIVCAMSGRRRFSLDVLGNYPGNAGVRSRE